MTLVGCNQSAPQESVEIFESEVQSKWVPLAERDTYLDVKKFVEDYFTIFDRGEYKVCSAYVYIDGSIDENTTLYTAFMNQDVSDVYMGLFMLSPMISIGEDVGMIYRDKSISAKDIRDVMDKTYLDAADSNIISALINAYYGLFDDKEEGVFDGNAPLTRAEYLTGVCKAYFPVQDLSVDDKLVSYITEDDPHVKFVSQMLPYSYYNTEDGRLNKETYYEPINVGEAIYTLVQLLLPEEYAQIQTNEDDIDKAYAIFQKYCNEVYDLNQKITKSEAIYLICSMFSAYAKENGYNLDTNEQMQDALFAEFIEESIKEGENTFPQYASDLNTFLSTGNQDILTEEIKDRIKCIVYTTEDPYRTILLEYIDEFEIGIMIDGDEDDRDKQDGAQAYYSQTDNTVNFEDASNQFIISLGDMAYQTLFHESGHAIDYNNAFYSGYMSEQYSIYSEVIGKNVTLQDAVFYDVYTQIEEQIRLRTDNDNEINNILESFKYGHNNRIDTLTENEKRIRNEVKEYFESVFDVSEDTTVMDAFGGVTNLAVDLPVGHRPVEGVDLDDYDYWYLTDGTPTGNQANELWAGYFAACVCSDDVELQAIQEYLPESYAVLESMTEQLYEDITE